MGDIADMMLDGTLCQKCGVYLESPSQGVPRSCRVCTHGLRVAPADRAARKLNERQRKDERARRLVEHYTRQPPANPREQQQFEAATARLAATVAALTQKGGEDGAHKSVRARA